MRELRRRARFDACRDVSRVTRRIDCGCVESTTPPKVADRVPGGAGPDPHRRKRTRSPNRRPACSCSTGRRMRRSTPASPRSRRSARANNFEVDKTTDAADFTADNLAQLPRGRLPQQRGRPAQRRAGGRAAGLRPGRRRLRRHRRAPPRPSPAARSSTGLIGARPDAAQPDRRQRPGRRRRRPGAPGDARACRWSGRARDVWYRWNPRPTGTVHTVARYHAPDAPAGDGTATGGTDWPISWCRDYQGGRSFYTGMGRTAASYGEAELPQAPARRDPVDRRPRPRRLQGDDHCQLQDRAHRQRRQRRPRQQRRVARRRRWPTTAGRSTSAAATAAPTPSAAR